MILYCNEIGMKFGRIVAVDNLSFQVGEGEIFGIAGPNGSGKTTVFNLINGLYKGSGQIVFEPYRSETDDDCLRACHAAQIALT